MFAGAATGDGLVAGGAGVEESGVMAWRRVVVVWMLRREGTIIGAAVFEALPEGRQRVMEDDAARMVVVGCTTAKELAVVAVVKLLRRANPPPRISRRPRDIMDSDRMMNLKLCPLSFVSFFLECGEQN